MLLFLPLAFFVGGCFCCLLLGDELTFFSFLTFLFLLPVHPLLLAGFALSLASLWAAAMRRRSVEPRRLWIWVFLFFWDDEVEFDPSISPIVSSGDATFGLTASDLYSWPHVAAERSVIVFVLSGLSLDKLLLPARSKVSLQPLGFGPASSVVEPGCWELEGEPLILVASPSTLEKVFGDLSAIASLS